MTPTQVQSNILNWTIQVLIRLGHRQLIFWYAFSADSSKMDPTKIKNHLHHSIFLLPPDSAHISRTTGPTEMVHLSTLAGLNKENHYSILEMNVQAIIVKKIECKLGMRFSINFFQSSLKF